MFTQISLAIREKQLYNQAQFLTNVCHEIKTPLAIISGHVENLINDTTIQNKKSLDVWRVMLEE